MQCKGHHSKQGSSPTLALTARISPCKLHAVSGTREGGLDEWALPGTIVIVTIGTATST